jgi:hypothetical protein
MISNIKIDHENIEIIFENITDGYLKCFGGTHKVNGLSLFIPLDYSHIYYDGFEFSSSMDEVFNPVDFDLLSFEEPRTIFEKKRRELGIGTYGLFFLSKNAFEINKIKKNLKSQCNYCVVMSYRAIDINNVKFLEYCSREIVELSSKIDWHGEQRRHAKSNLTHCAVSLYYVLMQIALLLSDERMFVDTINKVVSLTRSVKNYDYLSSSYFSVVLIHRLAAMYIDYRLVGMLYVESFKLSKISYSCHDEKLCNIRIMEFSNSLKKLSELRAFSLGKIKPEKKFFFESLRGARHDLMYKNFTSFERNIHVDIDIEGCVKVGPEFVDNVRDLAVSFEKKGDIEMAFYLMGLAFKERPNGPYIKKKFFDYKNILDTL